MINSLRFHNFKAFRSFYVPLRQTSVLVGANNAGKTTIIDAVKSLALMVRHARSRVPSVREESSGHLWVYEVSPDVIDVDEVNLRHEFRNEESWFEAELDSPRDARLRMTWPKTEDESPFFTILGRSGWQPTDTGQAAAELPTIGVIPVLTPVESSENLLDPKTVKRNFHGRLSSRHFRNQLVLMDREDLPGGLRSQSFGDFSDFLTEWTPEVKLERPNIDLSSGALDVYYTEASGQPKEISWIGDGTQVWFQILLHIYVLQNASTLVLDEPDIYLHADLQRTLLRVLESLPGQTLLATHSSEMLNEADPGTIVWVERSRPKAILAPESGDLDALYAAMGTRLKPRSCQSLPRPNGRVRGGSRHEGSEKPGRHSRSRAPCERGGYSLGSIGRVL